MEEIQNLYSKIRTMMDNRELPEDLRQAIESIYNEFYEFYEEDIKTAINSPALEEYLNAERKGAFNKIVAQYKNDCAERGEDAIEFLNKIEEQEPAEQMGTWRRNDLIYDIINSDNENVYTRADKIVDIVVDSISNSRNQMLMTLGRIYNRRKSKRRDR